MMSLSIRTRIILAMNLLVAGVAIAVGWTGVEVAGRAAERRLVDESAANAAGLFEMMRLPFSDELMSRLRQVLGSEVAVAPANGGGMVASSLPDHEAYELRRRLAEGALPRRITLAGHAYVVGTAQVEAPPAPPAPAQKACLYLLVPQAEVEAAKRAPRQTIVLVTLAAVALATLLGFALSTTISRPIRRLAERMQHLARQPGAGPPARQEPSVPEPGPTELAALGRSFDDLLGRLGAAREQLARSARLAALGQISASVAHELRNPLSAIKMNARVLADELAGPRPGEAGAGKAGAGAADSSLQRIIRETDRMNLYLEELLGLASGRRDPHDEALDLAALPVVRLETVAESVVELVADRCRHAGIEIHRRWDPKPAEVRADENQIRQVILNLVLNALDALPRGGTVTLSTRPASPIQAAPGQSPGEGRSVRFEVADSGAGVHVPEGADLFDPFVTTKPEGVGLGLYVSRRNVARHGGRIGYDTSERGTTFWFELPAAARHGG